MIEEVFAQGDSFLHRRDPRVKIIAACLFASAVALFSSKIAVGAAMAVAVVLLCLAQLPPLAVFKRLALVNSFTLLLWLTLPLTYGGEGTIRLGSLVLSQEGLDLALLITLKTNTIVPAIIALLTTSTVAEIGHALDKLRLPNKLCFILLYSYRYVFVIYQEYNKLLRAARLRAFSPATNLHTYKTFAYLFGMTLVKSYNRSQRVHQAMLLRGFDGKLISLHTYQVNWIDRIFLVLFFGAVVFAVLLNGWL